MSLSIRTNVASLTAQRNLYATQSSLDSSLSKLSSGFRITKAGDDAAGLGISTKLESQIRSYTQATRNANDGISVVQATESALNEQANILTRLRELAMQSGSDGVGNSERAYIQKESTALVAELQRISQTAEYNGTKLLDGSAATLDFQVGIAATTNDRISLNTLNATTSAGPVVGTGAAGRAAAGAAYATTVASTHLQSSAFDAAWPAAKLAGASDAEAVAWANAFDGVFSLGFEVAGGDLTTFTVPTGPSMNAGNAMVAALQAGGTGGGTAGSLLATAYQTYASWVAGHGGDLTGADTAVQSTLLPLVTAAGVANPNLVAAEANKAASAIFNAAYTAAGGTLGLATSVTLGTPETVAGLAALGLSTPVTPGAPGGGLGVAGLSLATKSGALAALASIDSALATISSNRATLGAAGNRFQSAISNIQAFSESLSAANSRIKDVDVAEETSRMSRSQILMQAGVSVLAQANQMPQMALKLLG